MQFKLPTNIKIEYKRLKTEHTNIPLLILRPKNVKEKRPCCLWIHGGGFALGMKEMAFMGRGVDLASKFGMTVVSPGYTLSVFKPFPQALIDCYSTLLFIRDNLDLLNAKSDQIFVGGESAGGGLCVSVCLLSRDQKSVNVAYAMPLYPMLDFRHTKSSVDNHGWVWNTKYNDLAWKVYLKGNREVSKYASPAIETDFEGFPPCYTFISDDEPFYCETLEFIDNLKNAGVHANVDVYPSNTHAFDMMKSKSYLTHLAVNKFEQELMFAIENFHAKN